MQHPPRFETLAALLDDSSRRFADHPLFGVRRDGVWSWTTYREFGDMVAACREGLVRLGASRGDRIAVISNNRLEWAVTAFATYTLGAVYVPMYETQLDAEWEHILRDSGASICFCANEVLFARAARLRPACPAIRSLVVFEGGARGALDYQELLASGRRRSVQISPVSGRDLASIIYTSGTTGNPKGVELTHFNLASNVSAILAVTPLSPGERSVGFLPWAHVYGGCLEIHSAMASGGSVAICDDPTRLMEYLQETRPTLLFAVPRIWNRIHEGVMGQMRGQSAFVQSVFKLGMSAQTKRRAGASPTLPEQLASMFCERVILPKIRARFGGRLRRAFSGAAALSRDVAELIDNLGIEVYEGYGMTECAGVITTNQPGQCRIGSVGRPVPGVTVRLEPPAEGHVERGEGEIVVYGAGVMRGYHGLAGASRQAMTTDGGLYTGDLGRFDEDGFLHITGRIKDLFKLSNGKYVAPTVIEERLQLSPHVSQCFVYGDDMPYPVALLVPAEPALLDWARQNGLSSPLEDVLHDPRTVALYTAELERLCEGLKGYERVRGFILDAEPLSPANGMLTPTLKLRRRELTRRYGARLRALYESPASNVERGAPRGAGLEAARI